MWFCLCVCVSVCALQWNVLEFLVGLDLSLTPKRGREIIFMTLRNSDKLCQIPARVCVCGCVCLAYLITDLHQNKMINDQLQAFLCFSCLNVELAAILEEKEDIFRRLKYCKSPFWPNLEASLYSEKDLEMHIPPQWLICSEWRNKVQNAAACLEEPKYTLSASRLFTLMSWWMHQGRCVGRHAGWRIRGSNHRPSEE